MKTSSLQLDADLSVLFTGPPKAEGPLPTLFYFALSAKDSLTTDPYNQPAAFLQDMPLRIFSLTLPAHEHSLPPQKALVHWAREMKEGKDFLSPFLLKAKRAIAFLIKDCWIKEGKLAVAGLSRGAFFATHLAALCPEIKVILGFAPLTTLTKTKEFSQIREAEELSLHTLTSLLYNRTIRFYIGNHDRRVGTEECFAFIHALAKEAAKHRIHSSSIELIIGPSIGHQGHGTPKERFQSGADWLKKELCSG